MMPAHTAPFRVVFRGLATIVVFAALSPRLAKAEGTAADKAVADSLFNDARSLMAKQEFAKACPKLLESQRLDPTPGTALYLADCYEKNGQTASAWGAFNDAAAMAHAAKQADRERIAKERAASLQSKLSTITILVASENDQAAISVMRDGALIRPAQWGTAIAIDPGPHKIEASSAGKAPWSTTATVGATADKVTVTVPALTADAPAKPIPGPAVVPAPAKPPPPPPTSVATPVEDKPSSPESSSSSSRQTIGFVVGGVGIVAVGAGVFLHFSATGKHDDAQNQCTPTCAAGGGQSLNDSAKSLATISTVSFVAGGLLIAGGLAMVLTAPSAGTSSSALRITPLAAPGGGGFLVAGAL